MVNEEENIKGKTIRDPSYGGGSSGALVYWNLIKEWRDANRLDHLDIKYDEMEKI